MAKRGGFPGMGGGMNMNAMIKQAQKMQQQMAKAQEEIAEMEHTATVGGGVVSATVKGTNLLQSVKISVLQIISQTYFRQSKSLKTVFQN